MSPCNESARDSSPSKVVKCVVVFTAKSIERILREGGTSSWRLDRNHARHCIYVICARNAYADWVEGPEAHHSAFLVGKISDVIVSPKRKDRWLIQFSEYALVNIPNVWSGDRNPVKYVTLEDAQWLNPSGLMWQPMPIPEAAEVEPTPTAQLANPEGSAPLTFSEAKKGLARTFGVAPEAIEITIRG